VSWVRRHLSELPVAPMPGRTIRINSEALRAKMDGGKSLEPKEPIMVNRFQRGGIYVRGKKKMYYGTFRIDTPEGRRSVNIPLGTTKELATKAAAREKLEGIISVTTKQNAVVPTAKVMKFSDLATEWRATEGVALGQITLHHYVSALRAYVTPEFADRDIRTINRKAVQDCLTKQAERYSRSSLRTLRLVMRMTLAWAERNGYIRQPSGWLDGIRLPKKVGGRNVVRTELKPEQTLAIVERLKEPYSTMVLFVASLGRRIEEATALQPEDLDENNVLHIRRVVYEGEVEVLEKEQLLPLDSVVHADLIRRIRELGVGKKWVFQSRAGTPINSGNVRRRFLHPAAAAVGVKIGGWHDFRHTLTRMMRRAGVNAVVVSGTLGHKSVELAAEVYDRASSTDIGQALHVVGKQLLPTVLPNQSEN
jgi:integrase